MHRPGQHPLHTAPPAYNEVLGYHVPKRYRGQQRVTGETHQTECMVRARCCHVAHNPNLKHSVAHECISTQSAAPAVCPLRQRVSRSSQRAALPWSTLRATITRARHSCSDRQYQQQRAVRILRPEATLAGIALCTNGLDPLLTHTNSLPILAHEPEHFCTFQ